MKEKLIIIFVASVLGLLVTTIAYYAYQSTRPSQAIPEKKSQPITLKPTPTPLPKVPLTIDEPKNESVVARRTIQVKGKTSPGSTIIVSTNTADEVVQPTSEGDFSVSIEIGTGVNKVITRAINSEGESYAEERVVTFTTEEF
jgi:hypothetical protein